MKNIFVKTLLVVASLAGAFASAHVSTPKAADATLLCSPPRCDDL